MKYITSLFLTMSVCFGLNAQQITGTVYDNNATALSGAYVYWEGTQQAATTDSDGKFSIGLSQTEKNRLIASFVGYQNDTIDVPTGVNHIEFVLSEGYLLGEAVVTASQQGTHFVRINPIQTQVITVAGLQTMACCNLAESFENSASVTVGFTDAVSGAKQIQMLGLSGIYTQMLDENIPTMRGLASTFGWNYVPGTWLESIHVSKGTSSVINGYESTTGQINMEFKKPDQTESLFINLFASNDMRMEANVTSATPVGKNLWTGLMLHGSTEQMEHDKNYPPDDFMDMPKTQQINVYNRWVYDNDEKRVESRTGFKFLHDKRESGQMSKIDFPRYQTNIENLNFSIFNKTGFALGKREGQSMGIISSFTHHEINSAYGAKKYDGKQNTFYINLLVSSFIGNTFHKYVVGGSFLYDRFDERYSDVLPANNTPLTPLFRKEIVSGVFAQYTYSYLEKMIVLVGLRGDYHNRFGVLLTPRTNIRYNITDNVIFRISAGKGYRSPSIISENIGFLASSKNIDVQSINDLKIEEAWNYGANLTFYIPMSQNKNVTIGLDYYRTDFVNQAIVDMEYNKRQIYFYNLRDLHGKSYANAWQLDVSAMPFRGLDIYAAFRLNDTKITYGKGEQNITVDKPLTNRYRGLINLSYATNFEKWKIDVTAQFNGSSRLPNLSETEYGYMEERSPAYPLYFAQITKKTKRLDIYAGCENIFDYKQKNPIIEAENPFGTDFDASRIWGPLMGRKFYAGIRLRLGEIK